MVLSVILFLMATALADIPY